MWVQSKGLGVIPSKLYGIEDPLAAFYFNRGVYQWGTLVEGKMKEVEARVRNSFKNRRGSEPFIAMERQKMFNRLMGIDSAKGVYRDVSLPSAESNMFGG